MHALQCCGAFCHITTRISHKFTYGPALLNLPPTLPPLPIPLGCHQIIIVFFLKNIKIIKKVTYNCHLSKVFNLKAQFCPVPGHQHGSTDSETGSAPAAFTLAAVLLGTESVKITSLGHEYVT